MKKLLPIFASALILFTSCDKKTTTPTVVENFAPGKAGSTWMYSYEDNIAATSGTYVLTKSGKDTLVNSKSYQVYTNTGGPNNYLAQVSNDYFQYAAIPGTDQKIEWLYLKNNVAVGYSWTQEISLDIPGMGKAKSTLTSRVEEKGISFVVAGATFSDVIRVKSTFGPITIPPYPPITPVSEINGYYANNVGRIMNTTKLNITMQTVPPIAVDNATKLRSYTIVK